MKGHWYQPGVLVIVALPVLLTGCQAESVRPVPQAVTNGVGVVDLDAALADAFKVQRPLVVLIAETGFGNADNEAIASLEDSAIKSRSDRVTLVLLDLGISRNRATAARFHVMDTPILACLSPRGVIVSRDEKAITRDLILKRMDEAVQSSPELDAKLGSLEAALASNANDASTKLNLADFLIAHQNAREAILQLASVAHSDTVEASVRIRAWVALARAHLWIAEPEKGRHEAQDLMATLGPKIPEALAGGNLVLGLQDAKGKRFALAGREFNEAIAAAPDSTYAKQATEEIAKLSAGGK